MNENSFESYYIEMRNMFRRTDSHFHALTVYIVILLQVSQKQTQIGLI